MIISTGFYWTINNNRNNLDVKIRYVRFYSFHHLKQHLQRSNSPSAGNVPSVEGLPLHPPTWVKQTRLENPLQTEASMGKT